MYYRIQERGRAASSQFVKGAKAAAEALEAILVARGLSLDDFPYCLRADDEAYDADVATDELAEELEESGATEIGAFRIRACRDSFDYGTAPFELIEARIAELAEHGGEVGALGPGPSGLALTLTPQTLFTTIRALGRIRDDGQFGSYEFWLETIEHRLELLRLLGIDEACGEPRGGAMREVDRKRLGFK
jgi:hypothetical protein